MIKNFNKYLQIDEKLPKTIVDLDNFRKSSFENPKELLKIIAEDKNLQAELLKIVEFNFFDFKNNKRTIINLIKITNLEFMTALCTALLISNTLPKNLFAYTIRSDEFLYSNTLSIYFINRWLSKFDNSLKSSLLIPAFLKNISKPIISKAISEHKLAEQFICEINRSSVIAGEEKFTGYKSSRVSANILKHWKLSPNIILPIAFFEDLQNAPEAFKIKSMILNVVNNITNPKEPLNSLDFDKSLVILNEYEFDTIFFKESFNEIKSSIFQVIK